MALYLILDIQCSMYKMCLSIFVQNKKKIFCCATYIKILYLNVCPVQIFLSLSIIAIIGDQNNNAIASKHNGIDRVEVLLLLIWFWTWPLFKIVCHQKSKLSYKGNHVTQDTWNFNALQVKIRYFSFLSPFYSVKNRREFQVYSPKIIK